MTVLRSLALRCSILRPVQHDWILRDLAFFPQRQGILSCRGSLHSTDGELVGGFIDLYCKQRETNHRVQERKNETGGNEGS